MQRKEFGMREKRPFKKSLRAQLICITSAIMLLIALITVYACYYISQSLLTQNQLQSAEYNLRSVSAHVQDDMDSILAFSRWCTSSSNIQNYLMTFRNQQPLGILARRDKIYMQYAVSAYERLHEEYYNTRASDYISRLLVSAENRKNYLQIMSTSLRNPPDAPDKIFEKDFFQRIYGVSGTVWIGLVNSPFQKSDFPVIPFVASVSDTQNQAEIGWVYMELSPELITNNLTYYPLSDDSALYITIGEQTYLYHNGVLSALENAWYITDTISYSSDWEDVHAFHVSLPSRTGEENTLITLPLGPEGWSISQVLSIQQLHEQKYIYYLLIISICLVIFLLTLVLLSFYNVQIGRPLIRIRRKIERISQGDFSLADDVRRNNELGDVERCIGHLSQNIVLLMEKRVEDERQRKNLEYEMLQNQINPHFLYNTLNTIKWMATLQHADGIADVTVSLGRLLKSVSKGKAGLVPLSEELSLLQDYFFIQKHRYGGFIHMTAELEPGLENCLIPRFSLQPLLENAIFHGLEPKSGQGDVIICIKREQDIIHISVTDNGLGMTDEQIKDVFARKGANPSSFFQKVGIRNVHDRIQYEFGTEYGITIESEPGNYTTIHVRIPVRRNDNE